MNKPRLRELYSFKKWEHEDKNINKWDLDRIPTRKERVLGILAGLGATLLSGSFSLIGALALFKTGFSSKNVIFSFIFLVLTCISLYVLCRALFSEPKKPGKISVLITSGLVFLLGVFIIPIALFADQIESGKCLSMLAAGFMSLGASIPMIKKFFGKSTEN